MEINELLRLSGIEVLKEHATGGILEKVIVVVNPSDENATIDDCKKELTPLELVAFLGSRDVQSINPIVYYPTAKGAANKDAKARLGAFKKASELINSAQDLTKQAEEAAKAIGVDINSFINRIQQGEQMDVEPEQVEPEMEDDVENEIEIDELKDKSLKESVSDGEKNGALDTAVKAKVSTDPFVKSQEEPKTSKEIDVPSEVLKDLDASIKENNDISDYYQKSGKHKEATNHLKIVDCLEHVKHLIEQRTRIEFDKAVVYYSSLQNQIQLGFPVSVQKWLVHGGGTGRSLKDYFDKAKNK